MVIIGSAQWAQRALHASGPSSCWSWQSLTSAFSNPVWRSSNLHNAQSSESLRMLLLKWSRPQVFFIKPWWKPNMTFPYPHKHPQFQEDFICHAERECEEHLHSSPRTVPLRKSISSRMVSVKVLNASEHATVSPCGFQRFQSERDILLSLLKTNIIRTPLFTTGSSSTVLFIRKSGN